MMNAYTANMITSVRAVPPGQTNTMILCPLTRRHAPRSVREKISSSQAWASEELNSRAGRKVAFAGQRHPPPVRVGYLRGGAGGLG